MRLFVTGVGGRLGSRLVKRFASEHEVVGFDRQDPPAWWPANARYVQGDMQDAQRVRDAAGDAIDAVIHLGAISGRVMHMPQSELFHINVQGTYHVLEAAQRAGAKVAVVASSLCALGLPDALDDHELDYLPIDENHPSRPRHTYDLTKLVNEVHAESFARLTGITTICFRFPLLTDVRNDPWFVDHLHRRPPRLVLADYLDFNDAIDLISVAMTRTDLDYEVLYVQADTAGMVGDVREHLARFEPGVEWRGEPPTESTPLIDSSRVRKIFNWSPRIIWQDGIAETVE